MAVLKIVIICFFLEIQFRQNRGNTGTEGSIEERKDDAVMGFHTVLLCILVFLYTSVVLSYRTLNDVFFYFTYQAVQTRGGAAGNENQNLLA